jgi:hypothetical protein
MYDSLLRSSRVVRLRARKCPTLGVWAPSGGACALDPRNALVFHQFWVLLLYLTLPARRKYPEQGEHQCVSGSSAQAPPEVAQTPNVRRFIEGAPLWMIAGVNHTISESSI